jgi:hypothetical protein
MTAYGQNVEHVHTTNARPWEVVWTAGSVLSDRRPMLLTLRLTNDGTRTECSTCPHNTCMIEGGCLHIRFSSSDRRQLCNTFCLNNNGTRTECSTCLPHKKTIEGGRLYWRVLFFQTAGNFVTHSALQTTSHTVLFNMFTPQKNDRGRTFVLAGSVLSDRRRTCSTFRLTTTAHGRNVQHVHTTKVRSREAIYTQGLGRTLTRAT